MLIKQFEKLADVLVENETCPAENRDFIVYGLSSALELSLSIITTLILGAIFGMFIESIVFLASFSFLRTYAGGYHAEKASTCYFASSLIVALVLIITKLIPLKFILIISLVFLIVSVPFILKLSPVSAKHKPLDKEEVAYFKKKIILHMAIELVFMIILLYFNQLRLVFICAFGMFILLIALLLQYILSK